MSSRGLILPNHGPDETVRRALGALSPGMWDHVQYSLVPGTNGGFDPTRPTCASTWKHRKRGTVYTSDCIGFAMWCLGADRYLPRTFKPQGGWVNTDGIVADSRRVDSLDRLFVRVEKPVPGCLVVYGGTRTVFGRKPGHVGVVVGDVGGYVETIHCHGPTLKGRAVSRTTALSWFKKRKDAIYVEFLR